MSDRATPPPSATRPLKLISIDDDPIFLLGLRTALESFPDLQVVASADNGVAALQILAPLMGTEDAIDLVILELGLCRASGEFAGLQLCQELKAYYPNLPIFLLSGFEEAPQLAAARQAGVEGYCAKGTAISVIVSALRAVAGGQTYWNIEFADTQNLRPYQTQTSRRDKLGDVGRRQIDNTLTEVTAQLQNPNLSTLDWFILAGRRRELRAARWLVNQLLPEARASTRRIVGRQGSGEVGTRGEPTPAPLSLRASPLSAIELRSENFFDATINKLKCGLENFTGVTMEIDILRDERKRELLYLILSKLDNVLDELRFSQVQPSRILSKRSLILQDLWQQATTDFFGRYYTLQVGKRELDVVNSLLQDADIVQKQILDKIPLFGEFIGYCLFQDSLIIDNVAYAYDTPEAIARAEALLENLVIEIANGVIQPLLNKFADVEVIKQNFYDRRLLSSREIARFRNNLSWKYRLEEYINEPTAMFESKYNLFVLNGSGIVKISIYAPRTAELEQLSGIQFAVTLILEIRDAIAPRLRSTVTFLGSGVVYLLTQVIGRGIGLIGRGIIQGIGNSLQETRYGKNSERPK